LPLKADITRVLRNDPEVTDHSFFIVFIGITVSAASCTILENPRKSRFPS